MTYSITRTDGTVVAQVLDQTTNATATPLTLIGRGDVSWGQSLNNNFVRLCENFAYTAAPSVPLTGMIWFDTGNSSMNYWNGSAWNIILDVVSLDTASSALAQQITSLSASLGSANASITSVYNAFVTASSAQATQITSLSASLGSANASITNVYNTLVTASSALSNQTTSLSSSLGSANASITNVYNTLVTASSALSNQISTLQSQVGSLSNASIVSGASAITTASSAVASQTSNQNTTNSLGTATFSQMATDISTSGSNVVEYSLEGYTSGSGVGSSGFVFQDIAYTSTTSVGVIQIVSLTSTIGTAVLNLTRTALSLGTQSWYAIQSSRNLYTTSFSLADYANGSSQVWIAADAFAISGKYQSGTTQYPLLTVDDTSKTVAIGVSGAGTSNIGNLVVTGNITCYGNISGVSSGSTTNIFQTYEQNTTTAGTSVVTSFDTSYTNLGPAVAVKPSVETNTVFISVTGDFSGVAYFNIAVGRSSDGSFGTAVLTQINSTGNNLTFKASDSGSLPNPTYYTVAASLDSVHDAAGSTLYVSNVVLTLNVPVT